MKRALIAGNWKMNTSAAEASSLARDIAAGLNELPENVDVLVCPPFPWLTLVASAVGPRVAVGAQNLWHEPNGAYTGEVSAGMLKEAGCSFVIVGHSERRHVIGETNELVNSKARASLTAGLEVILCIGELLAEREAGQTTSVLDAQLAGGLAGISDLSAVTVAYEPVWAIGTGVTASPEQAQDAHAHIRNWIGKHYTPESAAALRILYGGSVKPDNASDLLSQPDVDGALVGGASLKAESFLPIAAAATQI